MNLPDFPGRNLATSSEEAPDYGQDIVTVVDWPGGALNLHARSTIMEMGVCPHTSWHHCGQN